MRHDTGFIRHLLAAMMLASVLSGPAAAQQEDAPPPHSLQPQPALEAQEAAHYRLIDITDTGQRLVAVGQRGNIVISDDGKSWRQAASPVNVMLTRVRFLDEKHGWAVGYDAAILHSNDGGETWKVQHYNAESRQLYDILMLDAHNGIAVGGYATYLTTSDGGASWTPREFPLTQPGLHFNTVIKLGDGTLFIAGEKSMLAWSDDNGENWQMLNSPYHGSFFGAVPLGTRGVLVYGLRGHTFVSLDVKAATRQDPASFDPYNQVQIEDPVKMASMGWTPLTGGLDESMFGATALPDGEVLLAGVNGLSQKTTLSAGRLNPVALPTDATLSDLLVHGERVIGVGKRGVVDLGPLP